MVKGITAESAYQLLEIHFNKNGDAFFYIEAGRGAPSYNSGTLYGRLTMNKKNGHFQYCPKDTTDDCTLDFVADNGRIIVKTVNGTCPFGYGVYVDGTYKRFKKANPVYFVDREGDTVYFDKTTPEKYRY